MVRNRNMREVVREVDREGGRGEEGWKMDDYYTYVLFYYSCSPITTVPMLIQCYSLCLPWWAPRSTS